ncbi:MAG: hypothetical protein OXC11_14045 [Rhodospirillales bacterium]|nr:hypothetical protein [Rhodospirillales bacterium]
MSIHRNLMTVCFAAVFALGLAACSSSSDDPPADTGMMETGPTPEEQIATLQKEINDLRTQLGLEADDDLSDSISDLQDEVADLKQQIQDAADDESDRMAAEARATAAKLYAGIYAPAADATGTDVGNVHAAYNDAETAITVTMGDGTAANGTDLSEDKKTTVAANHGWAGKRYADPAGGDSYEAIVYSNVEASTMGKKFGGAAANDEFEYALTNGMITVDTSQAGVPARVALPGVTRTAGTETFKLPDPNPNNEQFITVSGNYHGVSGTYSCDTGADRDQACTASVAASGFTFAGTWTFKPSNPNARVMSAADIAYASYGWWLMKTENGKTFTASAFHDFKGTPGAVDIADLLGGTATYMGGAAGKYALASSTGGTNDAGHFTARATLEADFEDDMISGTIDMFMGADGMARDWSVELKEAALGTDGAITRDAANDTAWTIGGTAASASGEWSGNLREEGTDGVPKAASGTFYTEYGTAGKMVGGFGANKQ